MGEEEEEDEQGRKKKKKKKQGESYISLQADEHKEADGGEQSNDSEQVIEECSICLEVFVDGEELAAPGCGHLFHPQCLQEWVKQDTQMRCPVCRYNILDGLDSDGTSGAGGEGSGEVLDGNSSTTRQPQEGRFFFQALLSALQPRAARNASSAEPVLPVHQDALVDHLDQNRQHQHPVVL